MTIDYSKYGLDPNIASATNLLRQQAIEAAMEATNAELDALLETDEEDLGILSERRDEAAARADTLRREAKLTRKEISAHRVAAIGTKKVELARRHLQLEIEAKSKESMSLTPEAEKGEQALIESQLLALEQL